MQEVYGYTATWAGLASAPVGVIPVILSPIIGRFAHKLDMRRLVCFSFIMYAVCFYWRARTFEPGMDFGASAWPQFIQGFAVACFFMPLTTITLSRPAARSGWRRRRACRTSYLYPCRLHRDLDHHHPVDQPRGAASCAAHRIGDPL
ncbi:hypothetical protein MJ588_22000 [Klebsiella pneumoniae]|nr:hypothetical protein MJ588_22000 [Klebsiella pneumoniae]